MKTPFKILLILISLLLFNPNPCHAQPNSPIEVVKFFEKHYGGPLMDEIADFTTPKFRDNKPKSVWVVDTWKTLHKIKYEMLNSSVIYSKIKDNKAIFVLEPKIKTVAAKATQKGVYYLVKEGEKWLLDDLTVPEEEIDLEKMEM